MPDEEACSTKRELTQVEQARKASVVDKEMCKRRLQELVAEASSSRTASGVVSLSDGADRVVDETLDDVIIRDVGTVYGYTIIDLVGSSKTEPTLLLIGLRRYAQSSLEVFLPVFFFSKRMFKFLLNRHV